MSESIPAILAPLNNAPSDSAHLELDFPYFIEKKAPVTASPGLVDYQIHFDATLHGKDLRFKVAVTVPVTTLCPCSKAISERGAHNQRGLVRLEVTFGKTVWIEDLVALVESCASSEIFSLLKRPDEKHVTERAYDNPVFVEDLVRAVSLQCEPTPISLYASSRNFESITITAPRHDRTRLTLVASLPLFPSAHSHLSLNVLHVSCLLHRILVGLRPLSTAPGMAYGVTCFGFLLALGTPAMIISASKF